MLINAVTLEEKIAVLRTTVAFRDVTDATLRRVLERSQCKAVKRGEHLFLEGEEVAWIDVLASGVARTFYLTKQLREFTVELHSARDRGAGVPRSANARALDFAEC